MKTVRVRIAVAVNAEGNAGCSMVHDGGDAVARGFALELLDFDESGGCEAVHFVEADIPIPESTTVQGEVR